MFLRSGIRLTCDSTHIDSTRTLGGELDVAITNLSIKNLSAIFLLHINSVQETAGCALIPCYYRRHPWQFLRSVHC